MNNKVVFGQYYEAESWIHHLDPRTKLISLFLLMVSIFFIDNIYALLSFFCFVFILILTSKVPIGKFLNNLKMMFFLLVFTTFFQVAFNNSGNLIKDYSFQINIITTVIIGCLFVIYFTILKIIPIINKYRTIQFLLILFLCFYAQSIFKMNNGWIDYNIAIYSEGLVSAVRILLRVITLLLLSCLLTLTTKPTDLNNGLEKLLKPLSVFKIRVSILSMMISITLRFIPTLIDEANKILRAQASRGVDFKEGKIKDKISQIISLLIPMFIISYNKADDLANAMEARGYDPYSSRTSINELAFGFADWFIIVISNLFLVTIVVLKVFYAI